MSNSQLPKKNTNLPLLCYPAWRSNLLETVWVVIFYIFICWNLSSHNKVIYMQNCKYNWMTTIAVLSTVQFCNHKEITRTTECINFTEIINFLPMYWITNKVSWFNWARSTAARVFILAVVNGYFKSILLIFNDTLNHRSSTYLARIVVLRIEQMACSLSEIQLNRGIAYIRWNSNKKLYYEVILDA